MDKYFLAIVPKRDFYSVHERDYLEIVPKRDFSVDVARRDFQTIPDTENRIIYGAVFTHWGQTDIRLIDVIETYGVLP